MEVVGSRESQSYNVMRRFRGELLIAIHNQRREWETMINGGTVEVKVIGRERLDLYRNFMINLVSIDYLSATPNQLANSINVAQSVNEDAALHDIQFSALFTDNVTRHILTNTTIEERSNLVTELGNSCALWSINNGTQLDPGMKIDHLCVEYEEALLSNFRACVLILLQSMHFLTFLERPSQCLEMYSYL